MPRYWLLSLGGNHTPTCWVASVMSDSLQVCPRESPGKNTGAGGCFLLQGIFPAQGPIRHFLHWQVDSLPLRHQGSHQEQLYSDFKKKKKNPWNITYQFHPGVGNIGTLWLHLLLQSGNFSRYQWKWGINPLCSLLVFSRQPCLQQLSDPQSILLRKAVPRFSQARKLGLNKLR